MANGRKFKLNFDDSDEFGKFEPYLTMALESLKLANKTEDYLVSGERQITYQNAEMLNSQLPEKQIDSLDDDGYEKICDSATTITPPVSAVRNGLPTPNKCDLKSAQQSDSDSDRRLTYQRPLPPLPPLPSPGDRGKKNKDADACSKSPLQRRARSEDWSRDEEGYELPLQLNVTKRSSHNSTINLQNYTRLSPSASPSPPIASSTGSLQQLNKVFIVLC